MMATNSLCIKKKVMDKDLVKMNRVLLTGSQGTLLRTLERINEAPGLEEKSKRWKHALVAGVEKNQFFGL